MLDRLKNILRGAASILAIWPDGRGRLKRVHPYRSDAEALASDWERIGADLWKAVEREGQAVGVPWDTGGTLGGKQQR